MMTAAAALQPAPLPLALIAEANGDTRDLYTAALDQLVSEFAYAEDGRDALAKALANPPSVLIADTQLPFINGYELCRLLRRDVATHSVPIVIVTSRVLPAEVHTAKAAGADIVLAKPFALDMLRAELQRLAEQSAQLRERSRRSRDPIPALLAKSDALIQRSRTRRTPLSRAHVRGETTAPPLTPPSAFCPECDRKLVYRRSQVGGVTATHSEQWDYFECPGACGSFQYRHRTRKLRRL
jgi:CheY-like chemotaxis protein